MKTLITIVTRNNSVLLKNYIDSIESNDAGTDYDIVIADNSSDNVNHLKYLYFLSSKYKVETYKNDRAEATYASVVKKYLQDYDFHFLTHDDEYVHKKNWLKVFIDRMNSEYKEKIIEGTHYAGYRIGRVGATHQPWRSHTSCAGYNISSTFLQKCLEIYNSDPQIYKYCDQERVLYSRECLESSEICSLDTFSKMESENIELFNKLSSILNEQLQYQDEGIGPKNKYPPNKTWNKFMLLSEFMNSVAPLNKGFRTVGLEGDGFIEQVDGFDKPFGMNFIAHFGAPHTKKFLAKHFSSTPEQIHSKLYSNDLSFITKCNRIIKEYFK